MQNFSREVDRRMFICFYELESFVFVVKVLLFSKYNISRRYNSKHNVTKLCQCCEKRKVAALKRGASVTRKCLQKTIK
jgi:hypothetical protein